MNLKCIILIETGLKRLSTMWFHSYDILEKANVQKKKISVVVRNCMYRKGHTIKGTEETLRSNRNILMFYYNIILYKLLCIAFYNTVIQNAQKLLTFPNTKCKLKHYTFFSSNAFNFHCIVIFCFDSIQVKFFS
jgi:hypothetical protein